MLYKSAIVGVASTVTIYLLAKGHIGPDEAMLIGGVMTALGFTGGYYTTRNYKKK